MPICATQLALRLFPILVLDKVKQKGYTTSMIEEAKEVTEVEYPKWHGSPYDRGSADAWYRRPRSPHKYPNGTYNAPRVELTDPAEIKAYNAGYTKTMDQGDHKEWVL